MKVTFFFTSTKVGFQLPNIGYVLRVQSTQFISVSCLTLFGFGESKESSLWSLEPVLVLDNLDLGRGLGLTKAFWTPPLLDVSPALHEVGGNTFFKSISQARWEDLLLDRGGKEHIQVHMRERWCNKPIQYVVLDDVGGKKRTREIKAHTEQWNNARKLHHVDTCNGLSG